MDARYHYVVINIVLYFYFLPVQAFISGNYYATDYCNSKSNVIRTTFTGENATGVLLASRGNLAYKLGLDCNITIVAPKNHGIILRVENVSLPSENGTCLDYIEISGVPKTFETRKLCSSGGLTLNSSSIFVLQFHSHNSTRFISSFGIGYFRIIFTTYSETFPCSSFRCSNLFCISNDLKCDKVNNCGDNSDELDSEYGANCRKHRSKFVTSGPMLYDRYYTFQTFYQRVTFYPAFTFRPFTIDTNWKIQDTPRTHYDTNPAIIYVVIIPIVLIIKLVVYICCRAMRREGRAREALANRPLSSSYPIGTQMYPGVEATAPNQQSNPWLNQQGIVTEEPDFVDFPPPYSQVKAEEPPPPYLGEYNAPRLQKNDQDDVNVAPPSDCNPQSPSSHPVPHQTNNLPEVHGTRASSENNPQNSHPIYSISLARENS